MTCIITSNNELKIDESTVNVFPNPFNDELNVKFAKEIYGDVYVYTPDGKLILKDKIAGDTYEMKKGAIDINYRGILFMRVVSPETNGTFKLIKAQ